MKNRTMIISVSLAILITGLLIAKKMKSYLNNANLSRGLKNNNPGNIRLTADKWLGQVPATDSTDKSFVQFSAVAYGFRAMITVIMNIILKRKPRDLREFVNIYAPPIENNSSNYYSFLLNSGSKNIPGTESEMILLVYNMIIMENGQAIKSFISSADIKEGFDLVRWSL